MERIPVIDLMLAREGEVGAEMAAMADGARIATSGPCPLGTDTQFRCAHSER